jgi:hypothetical protein
MEIAGKRENMKKERRVGEDCVAHVAQAFAELS